MFVRFALLSAVVGAILVGFSHVGGPEEGLFFKLQRARAQAAEQLQATTPTETGTVFPAAPTPTQISIPDASPESSPVNPMPTDSATFPSASETASATTDTPFPAITDVAGSATATPTDAGATTTTSPTASPTSDTPSPTPTIDPSLPPLAATPDEIGTVKEATLDANGGRISTDDGRVVLDFPPGAISAPLDVKITKRQRLDFSDPSPDFPLVSNWSFDATTTDGASTAVHQFDQEFTATLRFSSDELVGRQPRSLAFWTLDEPTQRWIQVPSTAIESSGTLVARMNHFSDDGATAQRIADLAPLLDSHNTNLHAGSASLDIPIVVPPGPGGLVPDLHLSYDSGRLGEMRQYTDVASWTGLGWDLSVGSINISWESLRGQVIPRFFLNMNGIGGEMLHDDTSDGGQVVSSGTYRVRDQPYVNIQHACQDFGCPFVVTDQTGKNYTFGATSQTQRFYCELAYGCTHRMYQLDLDSTTDVLGNQIAYAYAQQTDYECGWSQCDYAIRSAYPTTITYNGDLAQIVFNRDSNRPDLPTEYHNGSCNYYPPTVIETGRLNSIDVKVKMGTTFQSVRKYSFTYGSTAFSNDAANCHNTQYQPPWRPKAGDLTLSSMSLRDSGDTSSLYTMAFQYSGQGGSPAVHFGYKQDIGQTTGEQSGFDRPHIVHADNGFGGYVQFTYNEKDKHGTTLHWTRSVVTEERHVSGGGQPDVVNTISYGAGPDAYDYPDPWEHTTADTFHSAYRGFNSVTETDTSGNKTVHTYYTSGTWNDELLNGRESSTVATDSDGAVWQTSSTTWSVRNVSGNEFYVRACGTQITCEQGYDANKYYVNFVYPSAKDTILRDGTHLHVNNQYDNGVTCAVVPATPACYGLLTQVDDLGDVDGAGLSRGARVITNTPYNTDTTHWVFVPQYEEKVDPANGNALLSSKSYYYDGKNSRTPAPAPAKGLLTATSTKLNSSQYSSSFHVYDSYGNRIQESVASFTLPENQTCGSVLGCMPSGVPNTTTEYDGIYHNFPKTKTAPTGASNPIVQTTTYDYTDIGSTGILNSGFLFGKPTSITDPNGRVTHIRYDGFGRTERTWDDLDAPGDLPTTTFTYGWGSVPNTTTVTQRTTSGTTNVRVSESCMDGFGREIARSEQYDGPTANQILMNYDGRSMKAVETNAAILDTSVHCPSSFSTASFDRTAYAYDPLGNVRSTTSIAANQTTGPYTITDYNGLTTTNYDQKSHKTVTSKNIGLRELAVQESAQTTILRPTVSQGFYHDWTASTPTVPANDHFQNIGETVSDDDAKQIHSSTVGASDSQVYSTTGLDPATAIYSVILHFRWKQSDATVPHPTQGMQPFFRQSATDSFSPMYTRTNEDGWRDDSWQMTTNPRTGQLWTVADANALEFGFKVSTAAGSHPYVSQAWVEVVAQAGLTYPDMSRVDLLGRRISHTDVFGTTSTTQYDVGGRKIDSVDADLGHWTYDYNAAGSLTTQTDARGITTTINYDTLERPKSKSYSNGEPTVGNTYDVYPDTGVCAEPTASAKGHLTQMTDGAGTQLSCYDIRGRAKKTDRFVSDSGSGTHYVSSATFDDLNQPKTLTYPDGEVVTYNTNSQGDVSSVLAGASTILSSVSRTPWHATNATLFGNNVSTTYGYDSRERIKTIASTGKDLTLTYDDASNVMGITDNISPSDNTTYTYDQLDRLTAMTVAGVGVASYAYDLVGNMTTKVESAAGALNNTNMSLLYLTHPHGVSSTQGTPTLGLPYDQNGNVTAGGGETFTYDTENRLKSRTGPSGTYTYTYDGNGTLLKRTSSSAGGSWTVYIGGGFEKNSDGSVVKYYQALGNTIAMRKAGTLYYMLSDHLSSTSVVTDSGMNIVASQRYWPFGAVRSVIQGTMPTDRQFTGQQIEPGGSPLGLYNYKARFYSTTLGRFLSVDPEMSNANDPQAWNGYSYVRNNPMRFTDPTGKRRIDQEEEDDANAATARAWRAAAAAFAEAAQAQEWTSQVFYPPPPCIECEQWVAAAESYRQTAAAQTWTSQVVEGAGGWSAPADDKGNRDSSLFGIPMSACNGDHGCPVVGMEFSANAAGPGAVANGQLGVYSDSEDRTRAGTSVNGGGGIGGISKNGKLGVSYNAGVGGKLGWAKGGSKAFGQANADQGVCAGIGPTVCLGMGWANGGGWFEYQIGFGANALGPLPISFYGTGGYSWLKSLW